MRNNDVKKVIEQFKSFYKSVNKLEHYRVPMHDRRNKTILKFIDTVKKYNNSSMIGDDFLNDYMAFQFNWWYRHDAKYGKGTSIQIEWIIGATAWKRWSSRSENFKKAAKYYVQKNFKGDLIDKKQIKVKIKSQWSKSIINVNQTEEFEKKMFFNTNKGLANCLINTTLYNHKSKYCMTCKNKIECKAELESQYPNVSKLRGY